MEGIAQDAIVMNLDDLLCTGIHDNLLFSSTIDRNKKLIPGEVIAAIVDGSQQFFDNIKKIWNKYSLPGGRNRRCRRRSEDNRGQWNHDGKMAKGKISDQ
jgi:hypothetical protein